MDIGKEVIRKELGLKNTTGDLDNRGPKALNGGGAEYPFLCCPLTQELYFQPYILKNCGHTYDIKAISQFLKKNGNCPICMASADLGDLVPNHSMKAVVDFHRKTGLF